MAKRTWTLSKLIDTHPEYRELLLALREVGVKYRDIVAITERVYGVRVTESALATTVRELRKAREYRAKNPKK